MNKPSYLFSAVLFTLALDAGVAAAADVANSSINPAKPASAASPDSAANPDSSTKAVPVAEIASKPAANAVPADAKTVTTDVASPETTEPEALETTATEAAEPTTETVETDAVTDETQVSETAFSGHDLSPWGMYQAADVVVKSVMILLLLASVATWTVLLFKTLQLQLARREAGKLLQQLNHCDNFASAASFNAGLKGEVTSLLQATELELQLSAQGNASGDGIKERVAARLDRSQAQLTRKINQGTGILATIGSVAPFVGLFGTVWGIMNSFIGIAQTNTTNLAVVAPGIAEALLATAIGLVAAIPAVVIYNYFSRAIAGYRAQLADIVSAIMVILSRDLDRRATPAIDHSESQISSALQDAG